MNLYLDNDHYLTLSGLKNGATDQYQNGATVGATLLDADGQAITGQTWPVILAYVTNSDGDYRGQVEDAVQVLEDQRLTARVTATAGGIKGQWDVPVFVSIRRE